jgi:hypothetical protein
MPNSHGRDSVQSVAASSKSILALLIGRGNIPMRSGMQFCASCALVVTVSAIATAEPTMRIRHLGVSPRGNNVWALEIAPDLVISPTGSPLALEVGLRISAETPIVNLSVNRSLAMYSNPGRMIFGWEQLTDVDSGLGVNLQSVGVQLKRSSGITTPAVASAESSNNSVTLGDVFIAAPAPLTGDYNNNGTVDAADFVLWGDNPGAFGGNPAGYNVWRTNFDRTAGAGASLSGEETIGVSSAITAPDEIFVALGTTDLTTSASKQIIQFETHGTTTAAGAIRIGGRYNANGTLAPVGAFVNGRLAQVQGASAQNFHNFAVGVFPTTQLVVEETLSGDLDADGFVNASDIDRLAWAAKNEPYGLLYDMNGDGTVTYSIGPPGSPNPSDSDVLIYDILETRYGDADLNHEVYLSDLSSLATHYRQGGQFGWAQGNFNGSQEAGTTVSPQVFLDDLSALATHWRFGVGGGGLSGAAVPEPSGLLMSLVLAIAALSLSVRR